MSYDCINTNTLHLLNIQTYFTLYIPAAWLCLFQPVRIEDKDPGYGLHHHTGLISGPFTILDQENLCHWGLIVGIKPHQKRKLIYRTAYSSEGSVPFFLRIRKWWGPASVRAVSSTIAHSIAILQLNEQLLAICRREMLVTPGGSHWTHFILALFFQKIDASVTAVIMRIYQYSFEIHYSVWSLLLIGTKFDDELQEQRYVFVKTENLGTKTSLFSTLIVKSNRQIIIWMQLVILWMGAAEGIFDFDLELKNRSSLATI